jgi:Flp pilus assembly pilin Flp
MNLGNRALDYLAGLGAQLQAQEGQAIVEYALIMALVTVIAIAALSTMGVNVASFFGKVNSALSSASSS